jgi:hypothetical protein
MLAVPLPVGWEVEGAPQEASSKMAPANIGQSIRCLSAVRPGVDGGTFATL